MLVLGGKGKEGYIVHVISGPETDLHLDIHGISLINITPLIQAMDPATPVFISLTRCRSEVLTSKCMQVAEIPHSCSFVAEPKEPEPLVKPGRGPIKVNAVPPSGRCSYCGKVDVELVGIPNVRICTSCAQIELGCKMVNAAVNVDVAAAATLGE